MKQFSTTSLSFPLPFLLSFLFAFCGVLFSSFSAETVGDPPCDTIVLTSGATISAEIIRTTSDLVEYRDCGAADRTVKTIPYDRVKSIKYVNNMRMSSASEDSTVSSQLIWSFVLALASYPVGFVISILLALMGVNPFVAVYIILIIAIIGLIMSIKGLRAAKKIGHKRHTGLGIAALIIAAIVIGTWWYWWLVFPALLLATLFLIWYSKDPTRR